jgi:hypothetical protein
MVAAEVMLVVVLVVVVVVLVVKMLVVKVVAAAAAREGVRGTLLEQHIRDFCVRTWPELLAVSIVAEIFEVCRGILHTQIAQLRTQNLSYGFSEMPPYIVCISSCFLNINVCEICRVCFKCQSRSPIPEPSGDFELGLEGYMSQPENGGGNFSDPYNGMP